jgi:ferric-dicitrate binding protein FerR (iron transport regulator)
MTSQRPPPPEGSLAEQAATWLICLKSPHFSPDDPYTDPAIRNAAFFEWLKRSPDHLLLFLELTELEHRLRRLDAGTLAEIRRLIRSST